MSEAADTRRMDNRRIAALAHEFVALNRRRTQGDPPLSIAELERWSELRESLSLEFGHTRPIGPETQPRHLRVPTHLKVRYGERPECAATLANVSEGGLFVICGEPLAPGTPLCLEIDDADSQEPVQLSGEVIHARPAATTEGPAGFGVEFHDIEVEDHARLCGLIERSLTQVSSSVR